ncbi:MAG: hypothetical protein ACR2NU_04350 [Aeoliella sp.]
MMRKTLLVLLVGTLVLGRGESAFAIKQFYDQWIEMYVDEEDDSDEAVEYKEIVTDSKTRCLVCHQGKKKKHHNPYGKHLKELLTKDDKEDTEKIIEALEEVGELPFDPEADPEDEDTIDFNEVIKKHELPGGELEDLQEEPEEEENGDG